jgi:transcriptional regulator with XRE-family HTH domain
MAKREKFGDLVRAARARRTQDEFARQLGVTTRTLARWEREEATPTPEQMSALRGAGVALRDSDDTEGPARWTCPGCNADLGESIFVSAGAKGFALKSCPSCSRRAGRHVFYRDEAFGYRLVNGCRYVQTWCTACRNNRPAAIPEHTC